MHKINKSVANYFILQHSLKKETGKFPVSSNPNMCSKSAMSLDALHYNLS